MRKTLLALLLSSAAASAPAQTDYTSDATLSATTSTDSVYVSNGATLTLTGNITVTDRIIVGMDSSNQTGSGALIISGGGTLNGDGQIGGLFPGATGTATITGAGSTWNTTNPTIGQAPGSSGTLTLSDGGKISVSDGAGSVIFGSVGATGVINIGAAANATAASAGIVNALKVYSDSATSSLQFNTTGTRAAPTYFTKDGTSTGGGVGTEGAFSLIHTGGVTVVSQELNHSGATIVNGGTLLINNDLTSSAVTVNGGTFGGDSVVGALVTVASGGTITPGAPGSRLTLVAGLTLETGAELAFELGSARNDITFFAGRLRGPSGTHGITLNLFDAGDFVADTYTLINFSDADTVTDFDLEDFTWGETISGYTYSLDIVGNRLQVTATAVPVAVPEPPTYAALAGVSALGLAAWRRRKLGDAGRRRLKHLIGTHIKKAGSEESVFLP